MRKRITQTIIKNCKVHGETEFAIITGTNKFYCRKCKAEQTVKRKNIIKQKCYEYLGNKCSCCGKVYPIYDFHHVNPKEKEYGICNGLNRNFSFEKLKQELDKCILLCGNCHAELHYEQNSKINKNYNSFRKYKSRYLNKLLAFKYLGNKCSKCGYDKCKDALVFHHINQEEKSINIGDYLQNNFNSLVKHELDKCQLLCVNCHRKIHLK